MGGGVFPPRGGAPRERTLRCVYDNVKRRLISILRQCRNVRSWPVRDLGTAVGTGPPGQASVCSAISKASSTSIPKYRTVLSNFVWPSNS
jgi:hypothetical protein